MTLYYFGVRFPKVSFKDLDRQKSKFHYHILYRGIP